MADSFFFTSPSLLLIICSFPHLNPSVSISHEEWCWKHKYMEVEVLDSDVLGVEFRQIGYILRCSLSHAITLVSNLLTSAV